VNVRARIARLAAASRGSAIRGVWKRPGGV
jgi:hypothetical protein